MLRVAMHTTSACSNGIHAQLLYHPARIYFLQQLFGGTVGLVIAKLL
jgi:hypothetical protein